MRSPCIPRSVGSYMFLVNLEDGVEVFQGLGGLILKQVQEMTIPVGIQEKGFQGDGPVQVVPCLLQFTKLEVGKQGTVNNGKFFSCFLILFYIIIILFYDPYHVCLFVCFYICVFKIEHNHIHKVTIFSSFYIIIHF